MNTTATVQFCGLQQPQVKPSEVTERHGVPKEVLLQCALLFIQGFLFFFDVLLDKPATIVVEMFENKCLLVRVSGLSTGVCIAIINNPFELLLTLCVILSGTPS